MVQPAEQFEIFLPGEDVVDSGILARQADCLADLAGLLPLLALFWYWRPPPAFEKEQRQEA